ncbi:WD40 repeat protein [Streptomyces sp. LBL]|uniref:WD40 repeat domain-containing protein n=1 Tax=Streptomyces sp. LBL TaxID=2940562 RepID=UPI0024733DA5|nr:hypothetical protein [Streptomyces sp. LBL]MDH6623375.1 WD40 repeat protein [Streptomyces sp. LBL]
MPNSKLNQLFSLLAEDESGREFTDSKRYGIIAALAGEPPRRGEIQSTKPLPDDRESGYLLSARHRKPAILASIFALALGVLVGATLPFSWYPAPSPPSYEFPPITHPSIRTIYSVEQSLNDSAVNSSMSPDGTTLAVGTKKGVVSLIDTADPDRKPLQLEDSGTITHTTFSPNGTILAVGNSEGKISLWRTADPSLDAPEETLAMREDGKSGGAVADIAFSPRGDLLAVGSSSGIVRIWKTHHSKPSEVVAGPSLFDSVSRLAFSRDGHFLAAGGIDKTVQLWDMSAPGNPLVTSYNTISSSGDINALAFTTRDRLAVGSADGVVSIWNVAQPEKPKKMSSSKPRGSTSDLTFDSQGRVLAASNANGTVSLWEDIADLESPIVLGNEESHSGLSSVNFKGSQDVLAVGGSNGSVQFWSKAWK